MIEYFHFFAFAELASINSTVPVEVTVCANRDISYNKEMLTKYGITEYDSDWFGNQTKLSGDEIFNKVTFDLSALIKVGLSNSIKFKLGSWSITNLNLKTQKRTRADVIF